MCAMPTLSFHFLNVGSGDCSIIKHGQSGHVSVIDVCCARKSADRAMKRALLEKYSISKEGANYQQKKHPVNPIEYIKSFVETSMFRFALSHPDMDHMDGIVDFFEEFSPINFYDTDNKKEMGSFEGSPYREEDWKFYKNMRDSNPQTNPKRQTLFSGDDNKHRTQDWEGNRPGDAFYTLTPTPELVASANEKDEDYNDASYVFLYHAAGGRILIPGDAHDNAWEHVIKTWKEKVKDVDLLLAPHHGRDSERSYDFLDIVNPKMTFFGNAKSEHLAYSAWRSRKLEFITNNQAGCMVVDCSGDNLTVYVTNERFARDRNPSTFYSDTYKAWYLKEVIGWDLKD